MHTTLAFAVLLLALGSSQALVFGRNHIVAEAEERPVDQDCLALADQGDCAFYNCFENRLPCGRNWFILRHGLFYCNKVNRELDTFPEQAQTFIRDSRRCQMQMLKDEYQQERISCHTLEHDAFSAISSCSIDHGFCSALRGNYAKFAQIFEIRDLFSTGAGKMWREMMSLVTQCGGEMLEELTVETSRTIRNAITDVAGTVRNTFSNLFDF